MKKIKADISLGNTKKEREDALKRMKKAQKLLLHFNLSAFAFDHGVKCLILHNRLHYIVDIARYVEFDKETWEFMEPLFKELVQWREYGKKFNMYMSNKERRKYEGVSKKL